MINKNTILRDYTKLKHLALRFADKKDYAKAVFYMQQAAFLMYNINLLYTDDELENLLKCISEQIIVRCSEKKQSKKRIIFYDYFVLENRGLTEQYLEALFSFEFDVLFIGCGENDKSSKIYDKLKEHDVEYKIVAEKDVIRKSQILFQIFEEFGPQIILVHTAPWDISGLMALNMYNCKRFLINITDHAFWIGTKVFDYFFEFRDYGYNISNNHRNIEPQRLLKMPYYPIINKAIKFAGFDFETENKKLIFSGGSIYKIQGSHIFFDIVKYILSNYSDTIFLFLGNGDSKYILSFIKENNYQNRFYYQSERKDIYEVFCHCDLYLNTYPLIGGLMTQYACVAGKIPLTLNDRKDHCNDISELLIGSKGREIEFDNIDELKSKLDFYMQNPDVLATKSEQMRDAVISPEMFNRVFLKYLTDERPLTQMVFKSYNIDIDKFAEQYLERLNDNNSLTYYRLFVDRRLKTFFHFPTYYFKYAFNRIIHI